MEKLISFTQRFRRRTYASVSEGQLVSLCTYVVSLRTEKMLSMFRNRTELTLFRAGKVPEMVPVRSLAIMACSERDHSVLNNGVTCSAAFVKTH